MDISAREKIDKSKPDCAPVALYMALEYFKKITHVGNGLQVNAGLIQEIYDAAGAMGDNSHYAVPWGICNAAVAYGLKATFVSKGPYKLVAGSDKDIRISLKERGDKLDEREIRNLVKHQTITATKKLY